MTTFRQQKFNAVSPSAGDVDVFTRSYLHILAPITNRNRQVTLNCTCTMSPFLIGKIASGCARRSKSHVFVCIMLVLTL